MIYIGDYTSDLGKTFFQTSLKVDFVEVAGTVTDLNPDPYLPLTFKANTRLRLPKDKPCPLRFTPRETWLYLISGDYFRVVTPFQPGTILWTTFYTELGVNPLVVSVDRKPEKVGAYITSLLLR